MVVMLGGCNSGGGGSGGSDGDGGGTTSEATSETRTGDSGSSVDDDGSLVRAMWIWGSEAVIDPARRSQLMDFAGDKGVTRFYAEAWSALVNEPDALAEFIRTSHSRGIEVELLFGDREWAFYENHQTVLDIADQMVDFVRRYPDARPIAMHLDVEPYSLQAWKDDKEYVANQMLDLYELVYQRLDGSGLLLVVDIPIWFDVHEITRNGETRLLHELVIDIVDGVALMDYRDTYDRIVNDAANELQYADRQQKTVVVGVETMCIEPETITFCEEGSDFMEGILERLDSEMPQQYGSYTGHAIHYFDSYMALQP